MGVLIRGRPGADVYDEASLLVLGGSTMKFAGAGVTATYDAATDIVTVTIAGGGASAGRRYFGKEELHGLAALSSKQGSTPNEMPIWIMSPSAVNGVGFVWQVPSDWDGGAVTVVLHYANNLAVAGDIVHDLTTALISVGDRVDEAGSTTQKVESYAGDPAFTHHTQTWTAELTPTAAGELWRINYRRRGSDAADTYVGNTYVVGIELQY